MFHVTGDAGALNRGHGAVQSIPIDLRLEKQGLQSRDLSSVSSQPGSEVRIDLPTRPVSLGCDAKQIRETSRLGGRNQVRVVLGRAPTRIRDELEMLQSAVHPHHRVHEIVGTVDFREVRVDRLDLRRTDRRGTSRKMRPKRSKR